MLCVLPGGLVDEAGTLHDEVELRALTGREEEILAARGRAESASLVTAVLSRCVERIGAVDTVDDAVVRRLLVADRQLIVLRLREATFGERVQGSVQCPWPGCGKRVAVSFSTRDVPVTASTDKGPLYEMKLSPEADEAERTVEFRLPTGADQESLSALVAENEAAALAALLGACVTRLGSGTCDDEVVATLSPRARQEIERRMHEVGPRLDLTMEADCAECGREFSAPFEIQDFFFGELRVTGDLLYRQVHQLAYHYHWSEREIMEMDHVQRNRYLAVLADELERIDESA
jgi:hypothetical protein